MRCVRLYIRLLMLQQLYVSKNALLQKANTEIVGEDDAFVYYLQCQDKIY